MHSRHEFNTIKIDIRLDASCKLTWICIHSAFYWRIRRGNNNGNKAVIENQFINFGSSTNELAIFFGRQHAKHACFKSFVYKVHECRLLTISKYVWNPELSTDHGTPIRELNSNWNNLTLKPISQTTVKFHMY